MINLRLLLLFLVLHSTVSYSQTTPRPTPVTVFEPQELPFEIVPILQLPKNPWRKQILGKFILISNGNENENYGSNLYYKRNRDSSWVAIYLDYNQVKMDTVNLDRRGEAELIIDCKGCSYTKDAGNCAGLYMIINTDDVPTAVLNIRNYCFTEGDMHTPQYYSDHLIRPIIIRNRIINIPAISQVENAKWARNNNCSLTYVAGGQYRFMGGRIRKVGK